MVIGNTAARVITSHLPTVSSGRCSGGFAVSRISFQASRRSRRGIGALTGAVVGGGAHRVLWVDGKRASGMYHVPRWIRARDASGCLRCDDAAVTTRIVPPIATPRYSLVSMSVPFMRLLLARDLVAAATEIGAAVPSDLPDRLDGFLQFRLADLAEDPATQPWLGRAIVAIEADGARVIGSVGFHSPPDTTAAWRSGTTSNRSTVARASPPKRSPRSWTGRPASTGSRAFGRRSPRTTSPRSGWPPGSASARSGIQLDDLEGSELILELDRPPAA